MGRMAQKNGGTRGIGEPDEIVRSLTFLASDDAGFTGGGKLNCAWKAERGPVVITFQIGDTFGLKHGNSEGTFQFGFGFQSNNTGNDDRLAVAGGDRAIDRAFGARSAISLGLSGDRGQAQGRGGQLLAALARE